MPYQAALDALVVVGNFLNQVTDTNVTAPLTQDQRNQALAAVNYAAGVLEAYSVKANNNNDIKAQTIICAILLECSALAYLIINLPYSYDAADLQFILDDYKIVRDDLKANVGVLQVYANGGVPTSQQIANSKVNLEQLKTKANAGALKAAQTKEPHLALIANFMQTTYTALYSISSTY